MNQASEECDGTDLSGCSAGETCNPSCKCVGGGGGPPPIECASYDRCSDITLDGELRCNDCNTVGQIDPIRDPAAINSYCVWDSGGCIVNSVTVEGLSCKIASDIPLCEVDQASIDISYTNTCDENCKSPGAGCTRTIPCRKSVQFPFFSWVNFVASFGLIGIIYVIFGFRREK